MLRTACVLDLADGKESFLADGGAESRRSCESQDEMWRFIVLKIYTAIDGLPQATLVRSLVLTCRVELTAPKPQSMPEARDPR